MKGFVDVIKLLISKNADIEARDDQKCTPLHNACRKGALDSVSVLLAYQANIYGLDNR